MRASLPLLLAITLLPATAAWAKGSADTTGYTDDVDGRCQAWAPSMLGQRDYALRYHGGCKNGRADGKGKAEWLYRYAEMKVKAAWEGEFRNGVFLDGQKIKGGVEPVQGDRYVVDMGTVNGADVQFISRSPQDGPMELCKVDQVALVLGAKINAADDDAVKRVMADGAALYRKACPNGKNLRVGVFTEPVKPRSNGMLPNPMANARVDDETGNLSGYSNEAAAKAQQEKQRAEFAQKQEETRKLFNEFSRKHNLAAWVTAQQLEENPFRWEGKNVGVVVRLDRMLTKDAALIRSGLRDWGPSLQLTGITPDFPESRRSVLLAAKVGKRERLADSNDNGSATFTTLRAIDSRVCERDACGDWFIWARGNRDMVWGEPFSAH
jgi:Fe2+ transport system protein FeoA